MTRALGVVGAQKVYTTTIRVKLKAVKDRKPSSALKWFRGANGPRV